MILSTWVASAATLLCAHAGVSALASGIILVGFPALAERELSAGAEAVGACFLFLAIAIAGASVVLMVADIIVGFGMRMARRLRFRADPDALGHLIAVGVVAFVCALPMPSSAATFNYSISFDGINAAQDGGDTIAGTVINPGDNFVLDVHAIPGGAYWVGSGLASTPAGFATTAGDRFAGATVDLFQSGSSQLHYVEAAGWQPSGYAGAQILNVGSTLTFDQMVVNYSLQGGDSFTLVAALGDILGGTPFFRMPEFVYNPPLGVSETPIPSALVLFASALLGLGALQRRRRKAAAAAFA